MENGKYLAILESIASLLEAGHEHLSATLVRNGLSGDDRSRQDFLKSNELWGGSGSIADQSLIGRSVERKELEMLLVQLGQLQLTDGEVNVRTKGWVEAFESWHQLGK